MLNFGTIGVYLCSVIKLSTHKIIDVMNDIDTINPCALSDQEIVTVGPALNKLFNLAGIAFLLTCLVYLVMHCL